MNRLSMFDQRFTALEIQKDIPDPQVFQKSRDTPNELIDELTFNHSPSIGFTNGNNMPHLLTNSILFGQSMPPMCATRAIEDVSSAVRKIQRAENGMPSRYSHKPLSHHVTGGASSAQDAETQAPTQVSATQCAPNRPLATQYSQQAGATSQARTVAPFTESAQGDLIWGSDVELPQPKEIISLPHIRGPTINILPPTESNMGNNKASTRASPQPRAVSASRSHPPPVAGGKMASDEGRIDIITEQSLASVTVPDPREKKLLPQPSESAKIQPSDPGLFNTTGAAQRIRPEIVIGSAMPKSMAQSAYSYGPPDQYPPPAPRLRTADTQVPSTADIGANADIVPGPMHGTTVEPPTASFFPEQTMYHTAVPGTPPAPAPAFTMHPAPVPSNSRVLNEPPSTVHMRLHETISCPLTATAPRKSVSPPRDRIHVVDFLYPPMAGWKPWDMLTQRLYWWALIMEEKSFVQALEDISLGRQVGAFSLSVFLMLAYKR